MAAATAQTHEINGNSLSKREFLIRPNCDLPHLPFPRDDSELVFGAQGDHRGLATIATTSSGSRTMTLKEDEDMTYQSVSPYDGKVLKTFEELTDKQLEMALEIAATCFETWRHKTFAERAAVVAKAAAIMHARVDEFARPVTLEMGKLFDEARAKWCSARTSSTTMPRTPSA